MIWWNSKWQLRIEAFQGITVIRWIMVFLTEDPILSVEPLKKYRMLNYMVIMFEHMWMARNKNWQGETSPNWNKVSKLISKTVGRYQKSNVNGNKQSDMYNKDNLPTKWKPPIAGELKLNFDVAFKNGKTTTEIILRNSAGEIKGVWVNHFNNENSFCAEVEAAI